MMHDMLTDLQHIAATRSLDMVITDVDVVDNNTPSLTTAAGELWSDQQHNIILSSDTVVVG